MSLRCQWCGFPQAFLGTSQSMFNFPNWLCEKIYFLVFVLQTIFVLNFAQNKEEMLIFLFIYFFKKKVFTRWKIYCWGRARECMLEGQFGFGKASKVETHSTWHSGFLPPPFYDNLPWIESSCWTVSTQSCPVLYQAVLVLLFASLYPSCKCHWAHPWGLLVLQSKIPYSRPIAFTEMSSHT